MPRLTGNQIRDIARRIIADEPGGIRYSVLVTRISTQHPETPRNSIHGAVWDLDKTFAGEIAKPSRGLFTLVANSAISAPKSKATRVAESSVKESDFYKSFAEWLQNDLDEATEAVALGGAGLRSKWGTPDVVGVFKPLPENRVRFEPEILSAEIKTNPNESITAFGQAAAYRLFSHKVYLVMPNTLPEEDQSRIEALAILFGIGFVLFDVNVDSPNYRVRVRAQRFSPDMFYVNEFADRLLDHNKSVFNTLFR